MITVTFFTRAMPLYRTGLDRIKKWKAKFVGDTIRDRINQVHDIAVERAEAGMMKFADAQELIRPILDKYEVTATDRAKYLGFANKLLKHAQRHGRGAFNKFAQGLKRYYVEAMNADPVILDEIINVIAGYVYAY